MSSTFFAYKHFVGKDSIPLVMLTDTNGVPVNPGGGGGGSVGVVLGVTDYLAKNAFAGASVGDQIRSLEWFDATSAPGVLQATVWVNETLKTTLGAPPLMTDLEKFMPLPIGAATAAKQDVGNTAITSIKDTDGIKKIQDALPTGNNVLGFVKQGNGVSTAAAWSVIIAEGATATITEVEATGAGTVPVGAYYADVFNIGNAPGVWNGASLPAGIAKSIPADSGTNLPAIAYNATGTTFLITYGVR